jgi:hypothetical protein
MGVDPIAMARSWSGDFADGLGSTGAGSGDQHPVNFQ